jgi:hypothetical protein
MNTSFYRLFYQSETLYSEQKTQIEAVAASPAVVAPAQAIAPAATAAPAPKPVPSTFTPLPVLKQQVLVLIDEDPELSTTDAAFLEKVLKAVNLDLTGVDIFNVTGKKRFDCKPLLQDKRVHHVISFGVPFLRVNIDVMMNRYDPKNVAGVQFLLAEPLVVIQADDANKRALWTSLKKLFL